MLTSDNDQNFFDMFFRMTDKPLLFLSCFGSGKNSA